MMRQARSVLVGTASLMMGGCLSMPPPPLATERPVRPLLLSSLSDRIQCELASVYQLGDLAKDMENFRGAVALDLKVTDRFTASAGGPLTVAFAGGSFIPSGSLSGGQETQRLGTVNFLVSFAALKDHACGSRERGALAMSTGWPEAAGTLGLDSWLQEMVRVINRGQPDRATMTSLDYTLQFDVQTDASAGFRIAPVNLAADVGGTARRGETNRLFVTITRNPVDPDPQQIEIVNWPSGIARSGEARGRPRTTTSRRVSPELQERLEERLNLLRSRTVPQVIAPAPFSR